MAHLVGPRMGSGKDPRTGYSYKWIPKHLADAQGVIAPRSMLVLFQSAARHALANSPRGKYMRLLAPEEIKAGLRETSSLRVGEVREEHPVILRLERLRHVALPAKEPAIVAALSKSTDADDFGEAGDRVLEELVRLGVVERLPNGKIDIPDIYRLHFRVDRPGQKISPVAAER